MVVILAEIVAFFMILGQGRGGGGQKQTHKNVYFCEHYENFPCNIQRFFFFFFFSEEKIENVLWVHVRTASEYPQFMFWIKNKKIRYTPANPSFLYKNGFEGVYISRTCFPEGILY